MSTSTKKITIRRAEEFTPDQIDAAAHILRDGFWSCNSPVLRFRAHNDRTALLELMRSRAKTAAGKGELVLAYHSPEVGKDNSEDGDKREVLVGAVVLSLPGEGFTQLQKSYGDQKKTESVSSPINESEAEKKTRLWVENDLVPWFNDFSTRSLGPGVLDNSLYISLFAVHPEWTGKGLGRETMNQVMAWGDEMGWDMTLFDHEPELVKFYSSFGFREVGREARDCDGTDVTWWAMKRDKRAAS